MRGYIKLQSADIWETVVIVYGVLFADWNKDNLVHEGAPFQGVWIPMHLIEIWNIDESQVRDWFFGLTGSLWSKDQVRRRIDHAEDVSPVAKNSS